MLNWFLLFATFTATFLLVNKTFSKCWIRKSRAVQIMIQVTRQNGSWKKPVKFSSFIIGRALHFPLQCVHQLHVLFKIHPWDKRRLSMLIYSRKIDWILYEFHQSFSNRQPQIRSQFQQPLSVDLLSQQQKMISQLKQHQANQASGISMNSPKRVELNPSNRQQLLSQTIIHQTYVQPQQSIPQAHILAQFQNQAATNMQLRQLSASSVIPSNYSPPIPGSTVAPNMNRNLACMQMSQVNYNFSQQQPPPHFGDMSQVISSDIYVNIHSTYLFLKPF